MANNPYVNKVQLADGTTLIDISDTTAIASDVAQGKYFYTLAGQKVQGTATGGGGIDINDLVMGTQPAGDVTLETATTIAGYAFRSYSLVTSVHAKAVTSFAAYAFQYCTVPVIVSEKGTSGGNNVFVHAEQLAKVDLNHTGSFSTNCFRYCYRLREMIMRKTGSVTTASAGTAVSTDNALSATANAPVIGGAIYVPKNLLANYKTATNWSTLYGKAYNMFLPIEGSIYETQYADGVAIPGATASNPIYFLENWGVISANNGDIPYALKSTSFRGMGISLRGDNSIRMRSTTGEPTFVYPMEIPTGKTGVTVTSDSCDIMVIEVAYANAEWGQTANSGWLLQSDGNAHSHIFTGTGTTHILVNIRQANDVSDTGTVTRAMCDAVTVSWNS